MSRARMVAASSLLQQVAQGFGIVALFVVVTLLARRLSLTEFGAYGLLAPLAGYLMVFRNIITAPAVRAMASAEGERDRSHAYSAALVLYAAGGLVAGAVIAVGGSLLADAVLAADPARQARLGALSLGGVTAVGIAASINLDALRADLQLVRSALIEIVGVGVFLALMLSLILGEAPLWALICANGTTALMSGTLSALAIRRLGLPYRFDLAGVTRERVTALLPTAGYLLIFEVSNFVVYALARPIIGLYKSAATVAMFEGPVRAHNLLYSIYGALGVTTLATSSRYSAQGEAEHLKQLMLRGSRYTLGLLVPVCIVLIVLAGPILEVWLGDEFEPGGTAMAILVSYWLLFSSLGVHHSLLVGANRAREVGRYMLGVGSGTLVLSLVLTPELGVEGPAVATAVSYACAFPFVQRLTLETTQVRLAEMARQAWLPAYSVGAVLAAGLVVLREVAAPESLVAVVGAAVGALGAAWLTWFLVWLRPDERAFLIGLVRRR